MAGYHKVVIKIVNNLVHYFGLKSLAKIGKIQHNAQVVERRLVETPEKKLSHANRTSVASHFRRPQLLLAVLCTFTFIVYSISLSFQFVWDDIFQIVDNPLIRSWHNVPRIFTTDLWVYVNRGQLYYRPLFTTWSVLNYSLFRLNPWGWHLMAILLHLAAVLVVYDAARKLRLTYWTSATAAVIFALHPIHIECVSWVSAASDTMVTIFYVLAFTAFLRFRESDQQTRLFWRIVSLALLACALLTKEMGLTFAGIVAAYVWILPANGPATSFKGKVREAFVAAFPYAVLTILYLLMRKYAMNAIVAVNEPHSFEEIVLTLPYVLAFYLRKLVLPAGLTGLYYTPYLTPDHLWLSALSLIALLAFAAFAWYVRRRTGDKTVTFLALWPLLTLVPALYLPNFQNGDFVRDRYTYLPSVGFALLVACALTLLPAVGRIKAQTLQLAAVSVLAIFFVMGGAQQVYWSNELTVFERGYQLYPQNLYAKVGLARVLQREGKTERSIQLLNETIAADPKRVTAYYLLAEAYSRVGQQSEGRKALAAALVLTRNTTQGELETADLAGLYGRLGDYEEAQRLCSKALSASPELFSALYNCGIVDFQVGRYADAERLLSQAVKQAPGEPAAVYWLGRVHLQEGQISQAQQDLNNAVNMRPDVADYHFWLAQALEGRGDMQRAQQQYQETLRLDPTHADVKVHLQRLGSPN